MANYTYFIMDESYRHNRERRLQYGADDYTTRYILGKRGLNILKEHTHSEEERAFLEKQADRLEAFEWAYNMVYLMKQACGHYELFQTHVNGEKEALEWLKMMAKEAQTRKCTRCTCGW